MKLDLSTLKLEGINKTKRKALCRKFKKEISTCEIEDEILDINKSEDLKDDLIQELLICKTSAEVALKGLLLNDVNDAKITFKPILMDYLSSNNDTFIYCIYNYCENIMNMLHNSDSFSLEDLFTFYTCYENMGDIIDVDKMLEYDSFTVNNRKFNKEDIHELNPCFEYLEDLLDSYAHGNSNRNNNESTDGQSHNFVDHNGKLIYRVTKCDREYALTNLFASIIDIYDVDFKQENFDTVEFNDNEFDKCIFTDTNISKRHLSKSNVLFSNCVFGFKHLILFQTIDDMNNNIFVKDNTRFQVVSSIHGHEMISINNKIKHLHEWKDMFKNGSDYVVGLSNDFEVLKSNFNKFISKFKK